MANPLASALRVNEISKITVCNWFLFWLCIGIAVAIGVVLLFVFTLLTGKVAVAMAMMPSLLIVAITVANNYFVYTMCTKLPEGFRAY